MAVAIKFNNVVGRQAAVDAKLPGGLPEAVLAFPMRPLTDGRLLVWPALMSGQGAEYLAAALHAAGLHYGVNADSDFAVVAPGFPESYPAWLEVGHVAERRTCWLKGTEPGELVDWRRPVGPG
jgi:hypothetical protein